MKYLVIIAVVASFLSAGTLFADEGKSSSVEVFVDGKKYDSMEGYREEEKKAEEEARHKAETASAPGDKDNVAELQSMFDQAVKSSKEPLDLKFDPAKMKTVYVQPPAEKSLEVPQAATIVFPPPADVSYSRDPFTQSYVVINQLGFNDGIHKVVSEFALTKKWKGQTVSADNLEDALRTSFSGSTKPLLLISDRNKLRLMELEPEDTDSSGGDSGTAAQ